MSPPSLSAPSLQSVSMTTLHPGPLHPVWQTQRQPLCSRVQRPCPLHRPGQPSEKACHEKRACLFDISEIVGGCCHKLERLINTFNNHIQIMSDCGEGQMRKNRRKKQSSYFSLSQYSSWYLWELIFLTHVRTHTDTHTAHRYCSVPPPSQADRCRSRRGTGHVPRSVDGMLSGRTRRQSSPPHTDTGPLSKHHGCHMAPGTALSDREKKRSEERHNEWVLGKTLRISFKSEDEKW